MTGEQFEKECRLKHYTDVAEQAQADRRGSPRRRRADAELDEAMALVRAAGYEIVERSE